MQNMFTLHNDRIHRPEPHAFGQIPMVLGRLKQPFVPAEPQLPQSKKKVMGTGVTFPFCKHLAPGINV